MVAKTNDGKLVALTGVLALGMLAAGCSAPTLAESTTGGERTSALADSAYNSMIDDPATGTRDWKSGAPEQSGIAYWHVGWVSKKGSSGASVEYVVATGYDRATRKEVVEVVIPQTESGVAYEVRALPGAPNLDEDKLAADIEEISDGLAKVLGGGTARVRGPSEDPGRAACVGGKAAYNRPRDNRTLRRCRVTASAYDSATGASAASGADKPPSDPIVVFLNIALDIAKTVQEQAHCDPDVQPLDDDYRQHPSSADDWPDDCSNGSALSSAGADPAKDAGADASGRTAGSSCPEVGKVCFSSDGSKRGTCGADFRCWQ
jgi:hypothetical protein